MYDRHQPSRPGGSWNINRLAPHATILGLDVERFMAEVWADAPRARVREDFKSGARDGVNGTPVFFVNGLRDDGPPGLDAMIAAIARHHER